MSLTDVLAIVGAVTGTTGSILGVMSYRRDRSKVVLSTQAGKAAIHDNFLLKINLRNAGRQPATIILVSVVRSRTRGVRALTPLARFGAGRKLIAKVGNIQNTRTVLDEIKGPLVLEPNERKEYVLRAANLEDGTSSRRGYTYVYAAEISMRYLSRRVKMDRDVVAWEDFD